MANYCPTCGVNYTAREHHCIEKKICRECGQEKPIAAFPVHPSSWDGHKHSCTVCYEAKKKQEKTRQTAYRIQTQSPKKQHARQNTLDQIALLRVHRPDHPSALWAKEMITALNAVVLDTETTGRGRDAEIIQIGIKEIQGQREYETLVQCQCASIPKDAEAIHHIKKSMLENAPTWPQLWDKLIRYLANREIIIYNADFDLRMLQQTAQRYQLPLPQLRTHCLMKQFSAYVGQPSSHPEGYRFLSLAAACAYFQIEQPNAHRALADAQAAFFVLQRLAAQAEEANGETSQDTSPKGRDTASTEPLSRAGGDRATQRQGEAILDYSQRREGSISQQERKEQQSTREMQNILLRTYGYHWRRTERLTDEQWRAIQTLMWYEDQTEEPQWVLLSPLEMPVNAATILQWLGERGTTSEDVRQFLCEHGFTAGKDERNIWSIESPEGEGVDLKHALKAIEQKRLDELAQRRSAALQKIQESFEQSTLCLKETLDLYGEAMNQASAWGYSPYPFAKRLVDGTIEVTTYHFEGEWQTTLCQTEKEAVDYLYANSDGTWDPGEWAKPI